MLFEANRQDGVLITYLLKYITKMRSFDYLFDCNKLSNIIEQQTTIIVTIYPMIRTTALHRN